MVSPLRFGWLLPRIRSHVFPATAVPVGSTTPGRTRETRLEDSFRTLTLMGRLRRYAGITIDRDTGPILSLYAFGPARSPAFLSTKI